MSASLYGDEEVTLGVGSADSAETATKSEDNAVYAAVLWIPDPTERRGWRDMWIAKKPESKPKSAGYRKP